MVLRHRTDNSRSSLGQALVETALILPILLILLLGAIDFGRAFFGWVGMHQVARIGSNFAATNPGIVTDTDLQDDLVALVSADVASLNCDPDANGSGGPDFNDFVLEFTTPGGTVTTTPVLGDYATLTVACDFSPITPLIDLLLGEPIAMSADAIFPVREGCINCPTPVPATPPPPPVQCFEVPDMEGMSVAGARLAWASRGFAPSSFTLVSGDETSTVDVATVDQNDPLSTCNFPAYAIFTSSVSVTTLTPVPPDGTCQTVPNLIGMTVGSAETAWQDAGFDQANFTADTSDLTRVVVDQTTVDPSDEGVSCLDPASTTIAVVSGAPWPAAPPVPCLVPNMIELSRSEGQAEWVQRGFDTNRFSPQTGGFTIRSQSLVGGTYVSCTAAVEVRANP